jgi:hypothetical protein
MEEIIQNLSANPLVQLGGFVLGAAGVVLAIIFYFRSRRISKLRFGYITRSFVEGLSGALDGLEVIYKDEPQRRRFG